MIGNLKTDQDLVALMVFLRELSPVCMFLSRRLASALSRRLLETSRATIQH